MLDHSAISRIADAVAAEQVIQIADAVTRVRDRHPSLAVALVTGLGAFIADRAARVVGLRIIPLAESIGVDGARAAPAAAVALLMDRRDAPRHSAVVARHARPGLAARTASAAIADVVFKLGGSLLAHGPVLDGVIEAIVDAARDTRAAIVPGGGPFADTVRAIDRQHSLDDDTAHWMAVLAMDQYAHLLAGRYATLVLAESGPQVQAALASGRVPVIAPYRWLRDADPLPHSWDVTSDSISAWLAGALGATRLVLVKPPGASGEDTVDACFGITVPAGLSWSVVPADRLGSRGLQEGQSP